MTIAELIQLLTRTHLLKYYNQQIVFQDCEEQIHDIDNKEEVTYLSVSSRHGDSEVIIRLKCISH